MAIATLVPMRAGKFTTLERRTVPPVGGRTVALTKVNVMLEGLEGVGRRIARRSISEVASWRADARFPVGFGGGGDGEGVEVWEREGGLRGFCWWGGRMEAVVVVVVRVDRPRRRVVRMEGNMVLSG